MKNLLKFLIPFLLVGYVSERNEHQEDDLHGERIPVNFSPTNWNPAILASYRDAMADTPLSQALAESGTSISRSGEKALVAATSSPFSVHAGIEVLRRGGNAMDAALTIALAQVANHLGGATSYAGHMQVMYFDASSSQVESLNASYATVLGEDDPMSIPGYGVPSGRAVLVPGFIAGIEKAHNRHGSIPFPALFEPAIYLAEEGLPISSQLAAMMRQRGDVLTRLESGRKLFLNEQGSLPKAGEVFKQPVVAGFLRNVQAQGADYMYTGAWAEQFVEAVRAEGGKISLEDMVGYSPEWSTLTPSKIRGIDVYASPNLIEKLRLAEYAGLRQLGHYSESADALYWLLKITRVNGAVGPHLVGNGISREEAEALIPELDLSDEGRYTEAMSKKIWQAMQTPAWSEIEARSEAEQVRQAEIIANLIRDFSVRSDDEGTDLGEASRPDHTAGVVVIDEQGNLVSLVHSVTSAIWGELGVFVEGVSVVDPGAFAQQMIQSAGPGRLLGFGGTSGIAACPAVLLMNGNPVLGCGNVGSSYDVVAQQGLINFVHYGLTPDELKRKPMFSKPWPPGQPVRLLTGGEGNFSEDMLAEMRARGIDLESTNDPFEVTAGGWWVVGTRDPETGVLSGAVASGVDLGIEGEDFGLVEAY